MKETEFEGKRIDDEVYGNPFNKKKRDSADRFYQDTKNIGHIRKAELMD